MTLLCNMRHLSRPFFTGSFHPVTPYLCLCCQVSILFTHYAATDLHSTPEAFQKTNTCNLKEYIHCLEELGFIKDAEDIMKDLKQKDAVEKGSGSKHIARRHMQVRLRFVKCLDARNIALGRHERVSGDGSL